MFTIELDSKQNESVSIENVETEVDTPRVKSEDYHETDYDLTILSTSRSVFSV